MAGKIPGLKKLNKRNSALAARYRYGLVVAQWNGDITEAMVNGALSIFSSIGVDKNNIEVFKVPGSFELPLAARWLLDRETFDAVVCLGCIIKGQTQHDEFIAHSISKGIMDLNLSYARPVIFGVLTVNTLEQAIDRSGGQLGNKGEEAALAAIEMLLLQSKLSLPNGHSVRQKS